MLTIQFNEIVNNKTTFVFQTLTETWSIDWGFSVR